MTVTKFLCTAQMRRSSICRALERAEIDLERKEKGKKWFW